MTPIEIRDTARAIAKEIGARARLYISICDAFNDKAIDVSVYPDGMGRDRAFSVSADDWPELFDGVRAKWAEFCDEHRRRTIRKMALEIIKITAEQGECSDAALRAGEFSAEDVARYAAEACADANEIASNGPFAVVALASANAA